VNHAIKNASDKGFAMHRLIVSLLLIILLLPASRARADALDDAYGDLAASALIISPEAFDSVRQGIEQLAVSGDPRAAAVIGALHDGNLYANDDRALFIQQPDGKYVDARTGAPPPT
jgi:urea transport system permease protein